MSGRPSGRTDIAALSVRGLRFRYPGGAEPVLHGIDFEVLPGEVLGVLGPNGSGKSTLLSAALNVKKGQRHGEIAFFGRSGVAAGSRRRIGYATQQVALYPRLTARENLVHAARLVLRRRDVPAALHRCVAEFKLHEVLDRRIGELSGGWQRLVHLAASFVHEPALRILDEPTAALDFHTRGHLVSLVRDWASRGAAVVVTSHYPEDLEEMCTRLVVIRQGRVIRSAALATLLAGLSRHLVVEASENGRDFTAKVPMPVCVGELARHTATALETAGASPEARLESVRQTAESLRSLLTEDPHLTGVIADD